MPPLLSVQPLCLEHGPPLSVDQQLRGFLEPQVFLAAIDLRAAHDLLCVFHFGLGLARLNQMGPRCLLLPGTPN